MSKSKIQITRPHSRLSVVMLALSIVLISAARFAPFPNVIPLPNGFQPEGIAAREGTTFFAGSIPTGAVYRGDVKTGAGAVLVPAQAGRNAIGMKYDSRTGLLFVAGGPSSKAFIYNGETGANVADVQLSAAASFINDVVITQGAVYFTNSFQPVIHKISLGEDGALPNPVQSETIPLSGDYVFSPGAFNANGIEATQNGKALIIVNSVDGALYKVDPISGEATRIDLGGGSVNNGDGILLQGKILYVVQNSLNQIAVVNLNPGFTSGNIVDLITNPLFRVPTTLAKFGEALYAVNARFGITPTPDTEYEIVRVLPK